MGDAFQELKKQNELLLKTLQEEKSARGALEAKLEVLLQQVSTRSEPERIQMLEKQQLKKVRDAVKAEAITVAKALSKGKAPTHVKYVTGSWYQRKGTNYPPGTVLKIPVNEEPAVDWKAWKPAVVTKAIGIDPDAAGTPLAEVRASRSALHFTKQSELAGDTVVSSVTPDQGEEQAAQTENTEQAPPQEQAPEAGATTRASDTEVG